MKKCPLCRGVGKRNLRTPVGRLCGLVGCRHCRGLGYIDDQIMVTFALDKKLAYAMAKERREGDKSIRLIIVG